MKKLIPALCLLLISAAMLGTSTFAWFSMNTTVSATNMTVKATASKNLLISKTSGSAGFGATVDMAASETSLVPASTIGGDVAAPVFYEIDPLNMGTMDPDSAARGATTQVKTTDAVDDTTNYLKQTVWLKIVGQAGGQLKATINVTSGGAQALDASIRVMLVDKTGNKTYIYAPLSGTYLTTGKAVNGKDASNYATLGDLTTLATSGTTAILASMTQDQAYEFDIYVWFEGEDPACKATNAVNLTNTVISISFTVADPA